VGRRVSVTPTAPMVWGGFSFDCNGKIKATVKLDARSKGSPQCTVHSPQLKDNAECNGHFSLSRPVTDCPSKENSPAKKEKSVGEKIDKGLDNTSQFSILNSPLSNLNSQPKIYVDGVLQGNGCIMLGEGAKDVVVEI
jgi:hypothetical protein